MMSEAVETEFFADDRLAGFRLQRIEIFNWGTVDWRGSGSRRPYSVMLDISFCGTGFMFSQIICTFFVLFRVS
jgi:hypothetical protein